MNVQNYSLRIRRSRGFTLVEILVVITIMSVLMLLIVPRVRIITKDRNIRETARVVGSMFANASQRATAEGKNAGVLIRRNGNFIDSNYVDSNGQPVPYAGTRLYLMRAVPDWAGDSESDMASKSTVNTGYISVPLPFGHTSETPVVAVNDRCYLNYQNFGYLITDVKINGNSLDLKLDTGLGSKSVYPEPPVLTIPSLTVSFRIERSPRIVESSAIDLPTGYQIDLRYSGWFTDNDAVQFMAIDDVADQSDIEVIFDETGGIDGVKCNADTPPVDAISSLYLFISEDDLELRPNQDPLVRDANLWVTVGNQTGGTSIGYNASPGEFVNNTNLMEMRNRITYARGLAANRQNANQ